MNLFVASTTESDPRTTVDPRTLGRLVFVEMSDDVDSDREAIEAVLERLDGIDEQALDELAFGLIKLDSTGRILALNKTEAELAQINRRRVLGKNFFDEVAPCTRVKAFRGRFLDGVARRELNESFGFIFQFPHGARYVAITLFYSQASQSVWVLVSKASTSPDFKPR